MSVVTVAEGFTRQCTSAPPPFPALLHCVTVAPVVFSRGTQSSSVLAPEPTHWLTVAGVAVVAPVMWLFTVTVQIVLPPPTLIEPLHWVIVWISLEEFTTVAAGGSTSVFAAWMLTTVLVVDLVAPVARLR
ncbi:hypothetical protein E3O53_06505 [Cryobacterium sp. TMT2-18-3]|uniref:hypothetical protein n=1 Tax=unclassified Cryobacterium TaxID=2649013 RepID=UPI00106AFA3D|nr:MULTISPECIES: hypothetical protein [unclassified Cryobacterium]TFC25963.1 hypothetical protein E3O22_13595 [Cryobacterium sp. TMT2-18-2]TFC32518.1 hypothetical protein E3O18_15695 [Cryobacterium sp. TMT2-42-4]TFC65397.1 hypothetical protein E3O53_06505 [Cryobacterium sp. TMT2-18-3]